MKHYSPCRAPAFSGEAPPLGAMFMARRGVTLIMDLSGGKVSAAAHPYIAVVSLKNRRRDHAGVKELDEASSAPMQVPQLV